MLDLRRGWQGVPRRLRRGIRLPAGAGTDAFPDFASLRGPPGLVRVYAMVKGPFDHRSWLSAVKSGRTFVTNAPLLELTLSTSAGIRYQIGDEVRLGPGSHMLRARVALRSAVPIDHLELIENGRVVAAIQLAAERTSIDTALSLRVAESGWYVLRARSDRPRLPVLDLHPFASTSPIYVSVGGKPVRSRPDAEYFLGWIDRVEAGLRAHTGWNTPVERDEVGQMLSVARAEFTRRAR